MVGIVRSATCKVFGWTAITLNEYSLVFYRISLVADVANIALAM